MLVLQILVLLVIFRQLHLILSMLVHRDEDVKSEASSNILKETIFAITSIFQSIKQSEDIVDAAKSKVGDKYLMSIFIVNFRFLRA